MCVGGGAGWVHVHVYVREYVMVKRLAKECEASCIISEPTDSGVFFFVIAAGGSGAGSTGRD